MTKDAIGASLVGIKNVSIHKSVALTIHVPQERAMEVINLFGWPTMIEPVHVVIARLDPKKIEVKEDLVPSCKYIANMDENYNFEINEDSPKPIREKTLAEYVGMVTSRENFQEYILKNHKAVWSNYVTEHNAQDEKAIINITSCCVRFICGVRSRSEIKYDTPAQEKWAELYNEYKTWLGRKS